MAERRPLTSAAVTLGTIGVLMIGTGFAITFLSDPDPANGGVALLVRVGALLAAIALVLPTVRRPSLPTILVAGAGLLAVLARPGLVWAALIGWSLWVLLGRQRRTSSKES